MASEHEPTSVPINLLEAFDEEAPVVEQIKTAIRVLAVTRRALEASGIAVRWNTSFQAPGAGEVQDDGPNFDSINTDEVAPLMRDVRLDELHHMIRAVEDISDEVIVSDGHVYAGDVLIKMAEHLGERMAQVKRITNRRPE